jgi:hypothetical protein
VIGGRVSVMLQQQLKTQAGYQGHSYWANLGSKEIENVNSAVNYNSYVHLDEIKLIVILDR